MSKLPTTYRDILLSGGEIPLPKFIINKLGLVHKDIMTKCLNSLYVNYLKNGSSTSTTYWHEQFPSSKVFNKFISLMSQAGWITSSVIEVHNWAELSLNESKLLTFVTTEELVEVRRAFKMKRYTLRTTGSEESNITKVGNTYGDTGIKRDGFAKSGNSLYQYDSNFIRKYRNIIEQNLTKAIDKLELKYEVFTDELDYASISKQLLDNYIDSGKWYCNGININDARGRAISQALKRIFNPISNKDARSLLVSKKAEPLTDIGERSAYLFIAELLGSKEKTIVQKENFGRLAFLRKELPEFHTSPRYTENMSEDDKLEEDARAESERGHFHERIWLERIYEGLDNHYIDNTYEWDIPIELDATASMLQIEGALLGHSPFLQKTNVIGDELQDMWYLDGVPRESFKKVLTRLLYGSSQTPAKILKGLGIPTTNEEIRLINRELKYGDASVANMFKNFIINNCEPKETMTPHIWNEKFTIKCNRYKQIGDYFKTYDIFNTATGLTDTISQTVMKSEADLHQFRRYFVTLLVHNLDSQIANYVCEQLEWCISIHDAFIVHPNDAYKVRKAYCAKLEEMYNDRESILKNYFHSIGIRSSSASEWSRLKKQIKGLNGQFRARPTALK